MQIDIKERKREIMRVELANAALDLVVSGGYQQTVEELADGLGISRATFFRHLGTKDEIVVAAVLGPVDLLADAYRGTAPREPVWQRLKASLAPLVEMAEASPERTRARLAFIRSEPALGSRLHRARRPQIDHLADAMVEEGHDPLGATVMAAAALAVFDRCWALWADDAKHDLQGIIDRGFAHLQGATPPAP